ncbi:MAG: amino acid/polyamine/organocation transporter, superfamily [Pseudonocardiales bacterium]|nr:amino acid/polyamine/organocation transporter, superfamily [Pseudonocardiales bacterium]
MTTLATGPETKLAAELVPEKVLPRVLNTFGLTAAYVFIICWISGSSVMATGGWSSVPMWVAGIVVFLIPAGLAVAELGNLWPAQGGVYVWAYRTMNEPLAFFGGFLSWIPVILNGASGPSVVLAFTLFALHAHVGLTMSIILQLLVLWLAAGLALRKLAATQRIMNVALVVYGIVAAAVLLVGIAHATRHSSGTPFSSHDLTTLNFGTYGWIFGLVLLYLVGVETPFNMGAEFLSVRRSATRMIFYGSVALSLIYVLATVGTMLALPGDKIDPIIGVASALKLGVPGTAEIAALAIAIILVVALTTYQSAYSRLVFVSGLERHLPRLFTHLNPRTRNPVTAILVQTCISSTLIVVLFSQASLSNVFLYLNGALSVVWLFSGFFFFVPVIIARRKYKERYATEDFWRIPGGMPIVLLVSLIGSVGTGAGIYYSFTLPFGPGISKSSWMTWLGLLVAGILMAAALVYFFGRRSASKLNHTDALAHLAVLESATPAA